VKWKSEGVMDGDRVAKVKTMNRLEANQSIKQANNQSINDADECRHVVRLCSHHNLEHNTIKFQISLSFKLPDRSPVPVSSAEFVLVVLISQELFLNAALSKTKWLLRKWQKR